LKEVLNTRFAMSVTAVKNERLFGVGIKELKADRT
jgi:hypothetical protein